MSLTEALPDDALGDAPGGDEEPGYRPRRRLEGLLGVPATEGNRLTLLHNGNEIFPAMLDSIRHARQAVDFMWPKRLPCRSNGGFEPLQGSLPGAGSFDRT
jgi:cardiolipin synthase